MHYNFLIHTFSLIAGTFLAILHHHWMLFDLLSSHLYACLTSCLTDIIIAVDLFTYIYIAIAIAIRYTYIYIAITIRISTDEYILQSYSYICMYA